VKHSNALEDRCAETHRGCESVSLRQRSSSKAARLPVADRSGVLLRNQVVVNGSTGQKAGIDPRIGSGQVNPRA